MKVIILAAGATTHGGELPWVLQPLGDRVILDYVVDLARHVVSPEQIYVVVESETDPVAAHLGDGYHYVVQPTPQGTGHAVLQAYSHLADHPGELLILYGDTPLFRRSSILGLLNRHRQKQATLTLLTGQSASGLPYGRIIRDQHGRIVDVVEAADANLAEQEITELNLGAYLLHAPALWPVLQEMAQSGRSPLPLTQVVRRLLQSGSMVESYRVLDQDEILGINTAEDLAQADFILQKRQLSPRRVEERNLIHFGTGGWRALIGEAFTLGNVRRLCQALANDILRQGRERDGVLIGYDRRFLSDVAGQVAAEVFAGNNIPTQLLTEDVPTPLVTYATAAQNVAYGLIFTASHNPPQWNGLKVFASDGSLPLDEQTQQIEDEANALTPDQVVKVELETALSSGLVRRVDYTNPYVDAIEKLIDLQVIREAGLRLVMDPMYGVGHNTLHIILTEARCRVTTIHARHDPLFGGRSPAPDLAALDTLVATVVQGDYDLGLAMDGDADRIAIVDEKGRYVSTNELLLLLYYYLHQVRGERGGVTRNLATTHLLDRLAAHFGESSYEVPVGFKHIAASMKSHNVLLAGESSGGLTIRGHILGKDGIFACALVVEMLARTRRTLADMLEEIYGLIGQLVSREVNLPATSEMKALVPRRLAAQEWREVAGYRVTGVSHLDGTKFTFENDNWLLLRFSGTEPLLRLFVEADSEVKADELLQWAQEMIQIR